ncbi:MAG TPA: AtpZ/AtpI family protein [Candidatus Saccharimonadales bacterium]
MKKAAAHPTTKSTSGNDRFSLGSLALDFLDTTWRIAVPVVIFAVLGIVADKRFGSMPWLTLLGMVIGFIFAGMLLKKQLEAANKQDKNA